MAKELSKEEKVKIVNLKILLERGLIKNSKDLFDAIPYSILAKGSYLQKYRSANYRIQHPSEIRLGDLVKIAKFLDVDIVFLARIFLDNINNQDRLNNLDNQNNLDDLDKLGL